MNPKYILSGVIPEPHDSRDFILAVPLEAAKNLPSRIDLRQYTGAIEDQLYTSSCVANATVSALEMLLERSGKFLHLSRLFNYYNIRKDYSNLRGIDGGAYLSDGFKSVYSLGIPAETTWEFNPQLVNTEPTQAAYTEALGRKVQRYERVGKFTIKTPVDDSYSVDMVKASLAMGYPVTVALVVNSTIFSVKGNLASPECKYKQIVNDDYPSAGGHAVVLVGYDDALGGFITENSWGETWGDQGYGIISYEVMKADCFDAWTCTAFDGVEYEPQWSFLPVDPVSAKIIVGVHPSYHDGDLFFRSGTLLCEVQNGTPDYQYKWTASDRDVVFVSEGALTVAQVMVVGWVEGESRSITVTCEVTDTSIPVQQSTKAQVLIRVTKAEVDRGQAYRLYKAAFNRLPDSAGLAFWEDKLKTGTTIQQIAFGFIQSAEFVSLYGTNPTAQEFCTLLYRNVLGREPDAQGLEFWVNNLSTGAISRVDALIGFSESKENKDTA